MRVRKIWLWKMVVNKWTCFVSFMVEPKIPVLELLLVSSGPVREQVGRLQGLLGDDKTSAQWRQLDCRLGDCLEEAKLSMTRLAETTAHGLALYLQDGQPKIPQPRGR